MVEFAVTLMVFLLIISGIIDLGHAFYMRQVVTNASREGARYGITYRTDTNGHRVAPTNFSPTIQSYLLTGYLASAPLPADADPQVTLAGAGYATGTKGANLEVSVTANKTWFVVSHFVPGMGSSITLRAVSIMQCE